jgi:hypothetical protein
MNTETVLNSVPVLQSQAGVPTVSGAPLVLMMCDVCELVGGPFAPREAAHLRAVHDRLHHGITSAAA